MSFHVPERYRIRGLAGEGNNGAFRILLAHKQTLLVIASDGLGWEHVSVSRADRCPTWNEMCAVKGLFWDEEDCVMQLHPPRAQYVNNHPYCLHLWRPVDSQIPLPESVLVGIRSMGELPV